LPLFIHVLVYFWLTFLLS